MSQAFAPSFAPATAAVRPGPDARLLFAAFAILTGWTTLAILPFYALDGADDAFYVEVAHLWTHGLPPYIGAFDVKGPGFFAILTAAQAVLGASLATLRIVQVLSIALGAASLFWLCDRFHDRATGVLCAILYPVLLVIFADAAYASLCAFVALAFLAALSQQSLLKKAALAGLAVGVACAIKQTAAFEAVALLVVIAREPAARGRALKAAFLFLAAASLVPLGFVIYYAWRGGLGVFFSDVVVFAFQRPTSSAEAISFWRGVGRLAYFQMPLLPVTVLAGAAVFNRRRLAARFPIGAISIWLAATILSILAQHTVSSYYLAPAIAPLLLLAAKRLTASAQGRGQKYLWASSALFLAFAVFVAAALHGGSLANGTQPKDDRAILAARSVIEAAHPRPGDRLFVVSRGGWLNAATDLAPPTAYFHWFHTLCDFPGAGLDRLAEAMATQPRFVVVADPSKHYRCEQASHWRVVNDALRSSYRLLARADGDFDFYRVYERD